MSSTYYDEIREEAFIMHALRLGLRSTESPIFTKTEFFWLGQDSLVVPPNPAHIRELVELAFYYDFGKGYGIHSALLDLAAKREHLEQYQTQSTRSVYWTTLGKYEYDYRKHIYLRDWLAEQQQSPDLNYNALAKRFALPKGTRVQVVELAYNAMRKLYLPNDTGKYRHEGATGVVVKGLFRLDLSQWFGVWVKHTSGHVAPYLLGEVAQVK